MVTVRANGPDFVFEVWAEPPLIYLDHWALRRLSENPAAGDRFFAALMNRGTVMFSLMNVVEIARDPVLDRAHEIRTFLEQLGPHWVPMTIDPLRIIHAEDSGRTPDDAHPCVSVGFLIDERFAARLAAGTVSLGHVVDLTRGAEGDILRQESEKDTARLLQNLQEWRDGHKSDPNALEQKYPSLRFDPQKPMHGIYNGLARLTITDSFKLNDNHARDLFHTVASVRCAEMVTLDAHWAGQVRKLKLPTDFVRVYSEADLDRFLADLEAAPAVR